jgi:hypothetical protein
VEHQCCIESVDTWRTNEPNRQDPPHIPTRPVTSRPKDFAFVFKTVWMFCCWLAKLKYSEYEFCKVTVEPS